MIRGRERGEDNLLIRRQEGTYTSCQQLVSNALDRHFIKRPCSDLSPYVYLARN